MSVPGFNPSPAAGFTRHPTPNGGAAPLYQNGPAQTYPSMHSQAGYGAPHPHYNSAPGHYAQMSSKAPPVNNQYGVNYYHSNYQQPVQTTARPGMASVFGAPQVHSSRPPVSSRAMGPTSNVSMSSASPLHTGPPQPGAYPASAGYYGGSMPLVAPAGTSAQGFPPHSSLATVPSAASSAYPIVSYPSAPRSSQYGTLPSSQTSAAGHNLVGAGPIPSSVSTAPQAPLQQVPLGHSVTSSWPSSAAVSAPPSYSGSLPGTVAAVNSQANTVPPSAVNRLDQSCQPPWTFGAVHPTADSPAPGRLATTTPTPPVSASLAQHEGMQYGNVANSRASSAPTPLSSSSDDEDDDGEEDEEAGADSSSTTSSASPVPSNYEALEGGSYPDTSLKLPPGPPVSQASKAAKPFGCGYPSLQPAYQQTPALSSYSTNSQSSNPSNPPGYQQASQPYPTMNQLSAALGGLSLPAQQLEALRPVNLMQDRNILPSTEIQSPVPNLSTDLKKANCSSDSFRCTLTNIPQTQALLNKAKLPLGLLLHPFRDLTQLPVITSNTIVRCRSCRTYINPFVSFLDQRRWKCNLCYRINDVPEEFMYNPLTRSYGEPHKRPEVQNSTVEFIASSDYMLRPPQPAVYLFVLDVSHNAVEAGYLNVLCQSLLENLDKLPGDMRTRVGFITFDSTIHFYNLQEGLSQPQMLVVSDIDDVFLPTPDSLLVNLKESKELVKDLLNALPGMFTNTRETHSALGPALQAAFKLMSPTGGRVSVFQTQLPSLGAGLLHSREDPNQRSSTKVVQHLGPATDFYKKLALDCSGQQIAVDLFLLSSQYSDLASLACVSKYSAGSIFYYPSFHHVHNPAQAETFQKDLRRYFTRKIGFEAVMRIRCTKGLSIHTFHGNFFVRSTDLLSLANVNPDSGFAVQMSIDESLADTALVCFQAALLYTSSKGKRRIRVHTLCLPVVSQLNDVFAGADVQAITCLLANMAVDRAISSNLTDSRDALVNAVVDSLSAYRSTTSSLQQSGVIAPYSLRLFPLYVLALLKQKALRTGTSTRLDDRVFAMCEFKCQPLQQIMRMIHPNLYRIDNLTNEGALHVNDSIVPQPPILQLSAERLTREGAFLMDCGSVFYLWVGKSCDVTFISDVLGYPNHASIPQNMTQIPELETPSSERTRSFITWLQENRSFNPVLYIMKDDTSAKTNFFQLLIEDRTEAALSYYEFLLHIQQQISK
ncbi:protein transport protein Sec24B [Acipenser oxyrinchus oxyrinchus]|uniref:Protein transport protein Sec24B n=1 Tax=Acipenser oxyrinchus oxyrinchus TaxID=40147 RepID=A0AAD8LVK1_ACIOX|nr:protein transport protein Sec24B [Acipenser oxyrinchus oxyrinchus]